MIRGARLASIAVFMGDVFIVSFYLPSAFNTIRENISDRTINYSESDFFDYWFDWFDRHDRWIDHSKYQSFHDWFD
jgi:hypothetical protein